VNRDCTWLYTSYILAIFFRKVVSKRFTECHRVTFFVFDVFAPSEGKEWREIIFVINPFSGPSRLRSFRSRIKFCSNFADNTFEKLVTCGAGFRVYSSV